MKYKQVWSFIVLLGTGIYIQAAQQINISGVVKDSKGSAVNEAVVSLASDPKKNDTTDSKGAFSITDGTAVHRSKTRLIPSQVIGNIGIRGDNLWFFIASPCYNGFISIFTGNGQTIAGIPIYKKDTGIHMYRIPDLSPGLYIMDITINHSTVTRKLVNTGREIYTSLESLAFMVDDSYISTATYAEVSDTLVVKKTGYRTVRKALTSLIQSDIEIITDTFNINKDNLFVSILGKTQEEVDAKIENAFGQLFHGRKNDQTIYYEDSKGAYIQDIKHNDVRSEGQSYGMTICAQLDKREEFDKIWAWSKKVMGFPLFKWRASPAGHATSNGSAPDGEEYFAAALIFGGTRWKDNNLISEGITVCNAMKRFFKGNIVRFVANSNYSDPSYILPAFYEVFSVADTNNKSFWKDCANAGRNFFHKTCDKNTMLAPALANWDGSPHSNRPYFEYDAWRVVGNIMMDWRFFHVDQWQKDEFAKKFSAFWRVQQTKIPMPAEIYLDGKVKAAFDPPYDGLIAINATLGHALPPDEAEFFVQALWDIVIPSGLERYYAGCLYLLALLHVSGKFQLYY